MKINVTPSNEYLLSIGISMEEAQSFISMYFKGTILDKELALELTKLRPEFKDLELKVKFLIQQKLFP